MIELQVENMSCGHCVSAVTKAVQALDPAAQVAVDLSAKKVSVASNAPVEKISAAIEDAGYPVIAQD
jgi:copper chaperone